MAGSATRQAAGPPALDEQGVRVKTALAVALLLLGSARAEDALAVASAPQRSLFYAGTRYGLQLDAGVPSGGTLALVARPWKFLRVNGGVGYNAVGFGVKGGVALVPFHWAVVPTVSLEGGRFFPADASRLVGGSSSAARQILSDVGYDYLSADLGLELGSQDRFVFYLRAGLSQLHARVRNVNAAVQEANVGVRMTVADPAVSARLPAVRLGFLVYAF